MNPTGQPMGEPMPSAPSGSAQDALNVPSLLIMILAGGGFLLAAFVLVSVFVGGNAAMVQALLKMAPNVPPDQRDALLQAASRREPGNAVGPVMIMGLSALTFYGALQMRNLKGFGLAMASAILVMLPCGSYCCCCLGIPVGIWALVTLNKPEVKSAFS